MKRSCEKPLNAAELRRGAEERLRESTREGARPGTKEETRRLLHELEVHQIELEMQNEELRQTHAQAETLLAQYTDLYDFAPVGYVTLDRDGTIRQVNLTGARLLGVERFRLMNRRFGLFVSEDSRPAFNAFLQKAFEGQTTETCEVALLKEGNQPIWAHIEATVSEDEQACRAAVVDITERKGAEEQLRLQAASLQAAANAITIADREARIAWVNPAFTRLTGYTSEEAVGQTPRLLKSGQQDPALYRTLWETILSGQVWNGEVVNRRKDGNLYTGEMTITPVRNACGEISHFIGIQQDITERKQAMAALAERTRQLEAVRIVSAEITRELDLPTLLELIHQRAADLVGGVSGAVFLWDEATQVLTPQAWHGLGPWMLVGACQLGEGVAGTVAQQRAPMIVNDYRTSPFAHPLILAHTGITAVLAAPLLYRERLLGAITIDKDDPGRPFTDQDRETLALFATQVAIAIENARLYAAAETRAGELSALREIDQAITARLELPAVLETVVAGAMQLLGAQHTQIILWDEATQTLRYGAALGPEAARVRAQTFELGRGINGAVAQTRQPMILDDYQASPYVLPEYPDIVATITVPILFEDRLLGVLHSHSTQAGRRFSTDDLRRFQMLAAQAAIAIENARLFAETQGHLVKLQAFYEATKLLTSERFLNALLRQAVEGAARVIGARYGAVGLVNEAGGLKAFIQTGLSPEEVARIGPPPTGRGILGVLIREGRSVRLADLTTDPRAHGFPPGHPPMRSFLGAPIVAQGKVLLGGLYLTEKVTGSFTQEDEALLVSFAEIVAGLIEKATLYEELRMAAVQLEGKVEDRTRDLHAANAQLQEAMRQVEAASRHKSEFLANMSHELRTPLSAVLGFAEFLLNQRVGPLTETQTRYLGHIRQGGQHLLSLITDILDLSKVEAGKVVLAPLPLSVGPTLEDILVIARGLAHKKAQTIEVQINPDLPPLMADPVRFKQILFNLLSNAVKFTPEHGTITLTARRVTEGQGPMTGDRGPATGAGTRPPSPVPCLELRVTDTGIGIRGEDLPKLFQEFVQLDPGRAQPDEGTGLGLALTKRLVELHGGRIWGESVGEGRGSTFTVVLPFGGPAG